MGWPPRLPLTRRGSTSAPAGFRFRPDDAERAAHKLRVELCEPVRATASSPLRVARTPVGKASGASDLEAIGACVVPLSELYAAMLAARKTVAKRMIGAAPMCCFLI